VGGGLSVFSLIYGWQAWLGQKFQGAEIFGFRDVTEEETAREVV